jgi:hypothetical protein
MFGTRSYEDELVFFGVPVCVDLGPTIPDRRMTYISAPGAKPPGPQVMPPAREPDALRSRAARMRGRARGEAATEIQTADNQRLRKSSPPPSAFAEAICTRLRDRKRAKLGAGLFMKPSA